MKRTFFQSFSDRYTKRSQSKSRTSESDCVMTPDVDNTTCTANTAIWQQVELWLSVVSTSCYSEIVLQVGRQRWHKVLKVDGLLRRYPYPGRKGERPARTLGGTSDRIKGYAPPPRKDLGHEDRGIPHPVNRQTPVETLPILIVR